MSFLLILFFLFGSCLSLPACSLCKQLVNLYKTSGDRDSFHTTASFICKAFKSEKQCSSFMDVFDVISAVAKYAPAKQVCRQLDMCGLGEQKIKKLQSVKPVACGTCKTLVGVVETLIQGNNNTLATVETTVKGLCKLIGGGEISSECDALIGDLHVVLNFVSQGLKPVIICEKMSLCVQSTAVAIIASPTPATCSFCETLVGIVDLALATGNATLAVIESAVECLLIGGGIISAECNIFIGDLQGIINYIAEGLTPVVVCVKLNMCTPTSAISKSVKIADPTPATCSLCETLVGVVDMGLASGNSTLALIEAAVEGLCKLIGGGLISAECNIFIGDLQAIINYVAQGLTPSVVCVKLNLCSPSSNMLIDSTMTASNSCSDYKSLSECVAQWDSLCCGWNSNFGCESFKGLTPYCKL